MALSKTCVVQVPVVYEMEEAAYGSSGHCKRDE